MSLFNKIAGAFVELEQEEKTTQNVPKRKMPQTLVVSSAITEVQAPFSTTDIRNSDEYKQFRQTFQKILDDENRRNFPGNDYYEFVVMKNAMHVIPQEDIKYTAAFAGWSQGQSATKVELVRTAKVYLGLVQKEITDFGAVYQQEYAQQVTKNEQLIGQKTAKVQELVEQMNKLNLEIGQLKDENMQNTMHLNTKRDAFAAAGEDTKTEIETEIVKINQYIN